MEFRPVSDQQETNRKHLRPFQPLIIVLVTLALPFMVFFFFRFLLAFLIALLCCIVFVVIWQLIARRKKASASLHDQWSEQLYDQGLQQYEQPQSQYPE